MNNYKFHTQILHNCERIKIKLQEFAGKIDW